MQIPSSNCSAYGTYKPDWGTISNIVEETSYGLWQLLVTSKGTQNRNTVIKASISVEFDERNVLIAGVPALMTQWTSDSSANALYGRVMSSNSSIEVVVGQKSSRQLLQVLERTYPQIMRYVQAVFPCTGSMWAIIMEGISFGFKSAVGGMIQATSPSPRLRIGYSTCLSSMWMSDTSITCRIGERNTMLNFVSLSIDVEQQKLSLANSSVHDFIRIKTLESESIRLSSGSKRVNAVVLNAGINDYTSKLRFGRCSPEAQRWLSDSSISGKSAAWSPKTFYNYSLFLSITARPIASTSFAIDQNTFLLRADNSTQKLSSFLSSSAVVLSVIGFDFAGQLSSLKISKTNFP